MPRHKQFRYGPRPFRPWKPFFGFFWVIILLMMFTGGKWWPALLVLIGLSILFNSVFRGTPPADPPQADFPPYVPPTTPPFQPGPAPRPAEPIQRADLLPTTCPQCGGPIRAYEVKWTGPHSATCAYCGSNLPMKKQS